MTFKMVIDDLADNLQNAILEMDRPVRDACVAAIHIAGGRVLELGRRDISKAGFGHRWQNTWKVRFYPETGVSSINAAAWAYHKIPYAEVFEDGATLHGRPMLWIPLRNAPKKFGRGHITPKDLRAQGIKLFSINKAGRVPLLATKIYGSPAQSRRLNFNVSVAALKKSRTTPKNPGSKQVRMTVPLFFGIRSVSIGKKFHLATIVNAERNALPGYYVANLKV